MPAKHAGKWCKSTIVLRAAATAATGTGTHAAHLRARLNFEWCGGGDSGDADGIGLCGAHSDVAIFIRPVNHPTGAYRQRVQSGGACGPWRGQIGQR